MASTLIYESLLQTPQIPSSLTVNLFSQVGKSAGLTLTQGGLTVGNTFNLMGSGTPTLSTRCGGATLTCSNWTYGFGDTALFDVGADDTLSLRQMLLVSNSRGYSVTALVTSGPGTRENRALHLGPSHRRPCRPDGLVGDGREQLQALLQRRP